MSISSRKTYLLRRRILRRVKRASFVFVHCTTLGAAAGLAAGTGFGLYRVWASARRRDLRCAPGGE
jgi:hypothetical protein